MIAGGWRGSLLAVVPFLCACSSESGATLQCGEGTTEVKGVCLPADADVPPDAPPDSGADAGDVSAPDADAAQDVASDVLALDDPCPASPAFLDCSSDCGGPSPDCSGPGSKATCKPSADTVGVSDAKAFPIVVRTPSKPGVDPACDSVCSGQAPVFGVSVAVAVPIDPVNGLRVTVGAPWRVQFANWVNFCLDGSVAGCAVYPTGSMVAIELLTDDPLAPARNAVIERLPNPLTCP